MENATSGIHKSESSDSFQDRKFAELDGISTDKRTLEESDTSVGSGKEFFRHQVEIFGQKYIIIGEETFEHIAFIAQFVDNKMKEVAQQSKGMSPLKIAILAALNISEEFVQLKESREIAIAKQDHLINMLAEAVENR